MNLSRIATRISSSSDLLIDSAEVVRASYYEEYEEDLWILKVEVTGSFPVDGPDAGKKFLAKVQAKATKPYGAEIITHEVEDKNTHDFSLMTDVFVDGKEVDYKLGSEGNRQMKEIVNSEAFKNAVTEALDAWTSVPQGQEDYVAPGH